MKQENEFLKDKIGELEADKAERQARETRWGDERARLEGIIFRDRPRRGLSEGDPMRFA